MTIVEEIKKYKFDNLEFYTLKDLKNHVENEIGLNVFDPINRKIEIRHKDLTTLFEIITQDQKIRNTLLKYLNVCFETEKESDNFNGFETEKINILDLKQ